MQEAHAPERRARAQVWQRRALIALCAIAALWHAQTYDFLCDDAFIALRYAKNLSQHHELAYNLGQRVEGFTSPLWVLLLSAAAALGAPLLTATRVLAGSAGLFSFWALTAYWDELEPRAPWLVVAPASALASTAPFAAWIFGGLETPLFVGTFTLSLAALGRASRKGDVRSHFEAGLAAAACTLCRPEGALLIALGSLAVALPSRDAAAPLRRLLAWFLPILLFVGGYELFRLLYFGYPLPNTFYVKTAGVGLWQRGVSYLGFAASEFGWALVGACGLSLGLLFVLQALPPPEQRPSRGTRTLTGCTAAATTFHLLYVARIGGDFLDLYRFLTPLLPAAFCIMTCAARSAFVRSRGPLRSAVPALAAGLFLLHLRNQWDMAHEAIQVAASSRAALHLEPLGWTRLYALRWRGIGSWLFRNRLPEDSTAVGAAGALPYFSELPNLDLFGLNDLETARRGRLIGNRPGHQRFATTDYLLAQRPTFVFLTPEATPLAPGRLHFDRYWGAHGYVPIQIRVDRELCDCAETFYHQFLVRSDRAASLQGRSDVAIGRLGFSG
ncbi:MAG TPA: hypothetical protein VFK05_19960 [Polyangiaceae bacterium]|nr:hypothetical protein [Polyangiaceae bacterium]